MGLLFLKQVKTDTAYVESSLLAGLRVRDFKIYDFISTLTARLLLVALTAAYINL